MIATELFGQSIYSSNYFCQNVYPLLPNIIAAKLSRYTVTKTKISMNLATKTTSKSVSADTKTKTNNS